MTCFMASPATTHCDSFLCFVTAIHCNILCIVPNTGGLVDDVLDVLHEKDEEDAALLLAQEEERQREEALRRRVGVLNNEGHMEKKSPAHNLWQVSFDLC